jgi:hypothetical protein
MKKLLIGASALAMVATPIAASAEPYGHDDRYQRFDHGDGAGAAVAAGVFGLVLGAALASNHHGYGYGGYGYGYRPYGYGPAYAARCHWETRAYPGPWGGVSYQNVRVCYRY